MSHLIKIKLPKKWVIFCILVFCLFIFSLIIILNFSNVCSKINPNKIKNKIDFEVEKVEDFSWYISIPKIKLEKAKIQEGISDEVLENTIGHFDETSKSIGNICLAAHNRGHTVNYFEKIGELEKEDEIIYHFENQMRIYKVESKTIIDVYDLSWLSQNEESNVITLITCVENNPNYRLCIRGIERSNK